MTRDELDIRKAVKENYGRLAGKQSSCCSSDCCGAEQQNRLGYTREQLSSIPGEAKEVSAGCGNPMAAAGVAEGQTVLDLGSGGGIDVFLAARVVGPHGRAIGVDATPEMVWRARETAQKSNIGNVEFRLGEIEHLPVESESVDVIISNCVINLSPDKKQVFREAFRTLKRGGTLAVSDIVLLERLPEIIEEHMPSWVECVAGAMLEKDYTGAMVEAGFQDIEIISRHTYTREQIESFFYSSREEELDEAFLDAARKEVDRIRIASSIVVARKPDK